MRTSQPLGVLSRVITNDVAVFSFGPFEPGTILKSLRLSAFCQQAGGGITQTDVFQICATSGRGVNHGAYVPADGNNPFAAFPGDRPVIRQASVPAYPFVGKHVVLFQEMYNGATLEAADHEVLSPGRDLILPLGLGVDDTNPNLIFGVYMAGTSGFGQVALLASIEVELP